MNKLIYILIMERFLSEKFTIVPTPDGRIAKYNPDAMCILTRSPATDGSCIYIGECRSNSYTLSAIIIEENAPVRLGYDMNPDYDQGVMSICSMVAHLSDDMSENMSAINVIEPIGCRIVNDNLELFVLSHKTQGMYYIIDLLDIEFVDEPLTKSAERS